MEAVHSCHDSEDFAPQSLRYRDSGRLMERSSKKSLPKPIETAMRWRHSIVPGGLCEKCRGINVESISRPDGYVLHQSVPSWEEGAQKCQCCNMLLRCTSRWWWREPFWRGENSECRAVLKLGYDRLAPQYPRLRLSFVSGELDTFSWMAYHKAIELYWENRGVYGNDGLYGTNHFLDGGSSREQHHDDTRALRVLAQKGYRVMEPVDRYDDPTVYAPPRMDLNATWFDLFTHESDPARTCGLRWRRSLPANTSCSASLKLAKTWIADCVEHGHLPSGVGRTSTSINAKRSSSRDQPARLIEVSTVNSLLSCKLWSFYAVRYIEP